MILEVSSKSGFTIQATKVTCPARVMEFLGIIVDGEQFELRKSEDRVSEIKSILADWRTKRVGTKRGLQSF